MNTKIFTDEQEKYIRHEVSIRMLDEKFKTIDAKINWVLATIISGFFLSIFLKIMGIF